MLGEQDRDCQDFKHCPRCAAATASHALDSCALGSSVLGPTALT